MKNDTPTITIKNEPLAVIDTRVSHDRQLDGSHEFQERECRKLAADLGIEVPEDGVWNTTISGDSDERRLLTHVLAYIDKRIKNGERRVTDYIFYDIERFTRGGHAMYEIMKKELEKRGVRLRDVAGVIQPKKNSMENLGMEYGWSHYSPSETQELLEADRAKDNKRVMLTRMIGQEIINAREGYAVHPAPDGLLNETAHYFSEGKRKSRTIRKLDPERARFYTAMFELRALGQMTDKEIAEIVNKMGFRTKMRTRWSKDKKEKKGTVGGFPLTEKQLQRVIQYPSYAGVNYESWTLWQPIRAQWAGLVSIKTWNDANRGLWHIEEKPNGALAIHKNYTPQDHSLDNPLYPLKNVVLCPICHNPFKGSASQGKSGRKFPAYHCERKVNRIKHKRFGVSKHKFEEKVEQFVNNLQLHPELLKSFQLVLMDTFNKKQSGAIDESKDAEKRVLEIQEQKQAAMKAYIAANDAGDEELKSDIQTERNRLNQLLKEAQGYRNSLEVNQQDLDEFIWRVNWVMEHPQEFLLRAGNKEQRRAYFSLMFDELPTYQNILDGTPSLTWIFKLKEPSEEAPKTEKSQMVPEVGVEPT